MVVTAAEQVAHGVNQKPVPAAGPAGPAACSYWAAAASALLGGRLTAHVTAHDPGGLGGWGPSQQEAPPQGGLLAVVVVVVLKLQGHWSASPKKAW